ncbi:MAG: copper amine oxidase N-terminal domain-containing protein [Defluviitaleaceae bacterium]|nr:copper amine oxidase N-terminal domain-containing protein [Defluviitaleaceae bacterium]
MKKLKNFASLAILLIVMIFALTACSEDVAALYSPDDIVTLEDHNPDAYGYDEYEGPVNMDWDDDFYGFDFENGPTFGSVTGQVTSVTTTHDGEKAFYIEVGESSAFLTTHFNTYIMGQEPEAGTTITGYFFLDTFMMAIYPPQYNVSVIVNNDDIQDDGIPFIFVDRFFELSDDQLKSADGELVINLGGDTEIILQSGEAFDGDLVGRVLVVSYAISTRSFPPQTTPIQIVVLYEMPTTGPEMIDLPDDWVFEDVDSHYCIVIDGEGLVGPLAIFMNPDVDFQTHVELMPVVEFLGSPAEWNQETGEVTLEGRNGSISFIVGSNDFNVDGQNVTLHNGSVDFYGTVYVPILFFRDVFGMGSAYSFEGRIYINTEADDMH